MSGSGTILDAIVARGTPVVVVASDRPCGGLERARRAGITTELIERTDFSRNFDRDAYSARVATVLAGHGVDLIAMAGWGTVFSEPMHAAFGGRILNTHPALLPSFPGWHAVRDALRYGVKVTGCTVHVAGLEVDTGRILAQRAVEVLDDDDEASLHERIKVAERDIYPATIEAIVAGRIVLDPVSDPPPTRSTL